MWRQYIYIRLTESHFDPEDLRAGVEHAINVILDDAVWMMQLDVRLMSLTPPLSRKGAATAILWGCLTCPKITGFKSSCSNLPLQWVLLWWVVGLDLVELTGAEVAAASGLSGGWMAKQDWKGTEEAAEEEGTATWKSKGGRASKVTIKEIEANSSAKSLEGNSALFGGLDSGGPTEQGGEVRLEQPGSRFNLATVHLCRVRESLIYFERRIDELEYWMWQEVTIDNNACTTNITPSSFSRIDHHVSHLWLFDWPSSPRCHLDMNLMMVSCHFKMEL